MMFRVGPFLLLFWGRGFMFEKNEVNLLDCSYFEIIMTTGYHFVIKSKNTGHYWDVACKELFFGKRFLVVYHKHKLEDRFHIQKGLHPRSILEAQQQIKEHDIYHISHRVKNKNGRKKG